MNAKPITLLFVVLALVGIITFTPSAFADTSVTITKGSSGGQACVTANNCFDPANAQVAVGEHVTWTNADTASHTITSGMPSDNVTGADFDSSVIKSGATFSLQFPNAGTYNYYCQIHPWMTGMVTVGGTAPSPTPTITVSTDKSSYTINDSIVVSGVVKAVVPGTPITIQIFNANNNLVNVDAIDVSQDGTYSDTNIKAKGPSWASSGTYTVKVQYGPTVTTQTTFIFQGAANPISSVFPVKDPTSQQTFNVDYTINGGTVKNITINPQNISLIVTLSSTADGSVTFQIPRSLIDAKTNTGQDDKFVILIDGAQVIPQNEQTSITDRTITIQFLQGDQNIQIIGTNIVNTQSSQPPQTNNAQAIYDEIQKRIEDAKRSHQVLQGKSSDGSTIVTIDSTKPTVGHPLPIAISFTDSSGHKILHQNYAISVTQDGNSVLTNTAGHTHTGDDMQIINNLASSNPVDIRITLNGIGLPGTDPSTWTGPKGEIIIPRIVQVTPQQPPIPHGTDVIMSKGSSSGQACVAANNCFDPANVQIAAGDTVTWTNADTASHTVTSGKVSDNVTGTLFDSGLIHSPQSTTIPISSSTFSFKFTNAGTFNYYCQVHPWMIGQIIVGSGTPQPTPPPRQIPPIAVTISISSDRPSYNLNDVVNLMVSIPGAGSGQNIAVSVSDPSGTGIISRTITTDTTGSGTLQFKISNNAITGTYQVVSTASVNGQNIKSSTQFTVTAQSSVSIISVQPTDQQGNPVTSFSRGTNGFVKVVLSAQSSVPSLVTVNLSGADQTIIGLGSLKSTLGSGNSEITLSFFIPSNAASGTANIYADAFSDWPRNGGIPLTKESQVTVEIQ